MTPISLLSSKYLVQPRPTSQTLASQGWARN